VMGQTHRDRVFAMSPSARTPKLEAPWPDLTRLAPDRDVHLWSGRMRVDTPGGSFVGPSQIRLSWRRSPSITYRIASHNSGVAVAATFGGDRREVTPRVTGIPQLVPGRRLWRGSEPGRQFTTRTGGHLPRMVFGDEGLIDTLVVGIINFDKALRLRWTLLEGEDESRPLLALDVPPWNLTLLGRPGRDDWRPSVRDSRGFAFTHALRIERQDGGSFTLADAELLLEAVFHVFSFANGALVGQALPMGYCAGKLVTISWSCTAVDGWSEALSWFDYSNAEDLAQLLRGYLLKATDEFWRALLVRSIRMLLAANTADPVDATVPVALSALELMSWALDLSDETRAAAQVRALQQWIGASPDVPPSLPSLEAYRAARAPDLSDVADALAAVRNRLVHPPRTTTAGWPSVEVMIDAWRLALEFGELALLKVLGHDGNYGHRRHVAGRWVGLRVDRSGYRSVAGRRELSFDLMWRCRPRLPAPPPIPIGMSRNLPTRRFTE